MKEKSEFLYPHRIIDTSNIRSLLSSSSSHGLCGGHNLGNTCFMNSSIACLSNTLELTIYFLTKAYLKDINKENPRGTKGKLAKEWYNLLYQYWIQKTKTGDPSDFKKVISKKASIFRGYEQQDSNEFMIIFLDYLNEDLNKVTKEVYEEISEQKKGENDIDCAKRFWDLHIRRNNSIITDLFSGQYKSTIHCPNCNWISQTYDPFNNLILPIPKQKYSQNKNITLFFIPNFSIRNSFKIMINANKKTQVKDVYLLLNNIDDFPYQCKKLNFIDVEEGRFLGVCKDNYEIFKNDNYLFCSEEDENYKKIIPLYITTDDDDLSAYPRIFYTSEKMSFDEFKMRIYFFARKYIKNPFGIKEEEDEFLKIYNDYCEDYEYDENKIISFMKDEYEQIFLNENEENELIKNFIKDIPFQFLLQRNNKKINLLSVTNLEEKLNELGISIEGKTEVEKIINLIEKKQYELIIVFKKRSSYIKRSNLKFNKCSSVASEEYKKELTKSEKERNACSLEDCLEKFREEEILDEKNKWYCKNCKSFQKAKKKMELFYLPKILIICLKRFSNSYNRWEKNNKLVDFPINNLDMENFICGPNKNNFKYDLFAVSQHYGSCRGGHYTAICQNFGSWYSYNDSSVSLADENDIVNNAAYVLFYRRQSD